MKRLRELAKLALVFAATACGDGQKADAAPEPDSAQAQAPDAQASLPPECRDLMKMNWGIADIPAFKNQYVSQKNWKAFLNAMDPDNGRAYTNSEIFIYAHIFAAEGGMRETYTYKKDKDGKTVKDKNGDAVKIKHSTRGGILNGTLDELRNFHSNTEVQDILSRYETTDDIKAENMPELYAIYFDYAFRAIGGHKAISDENTLNTLAATALADTVFRFGPKGGAKVIAQAIDSMAPDHISAQNPDLVGPVIFSAYRELAQDPDSLPSLLRAVTEKYTATAPDEKTRAENLRFIPYTGEITLRQENCTTALAAQTPDKNKPATPSNG